MYIEGVRLSQIIRVIVRRWPDWSLAQIADWVECTPKYVRSVMISRRIWHPELAEALGELDKQYHANLLRLWEKCQESPDMSFRAEMASAVSERLKKIETAPARMPARI